MKIKSGIEIHQQLDSHKLFCNCPSVLRKDRPIFEVRRKLHAVAGESGKVDIAAQHEADQDREFVYEGYDSTCLVELDDDPPHLINKEALRIGLHVALLLNCEIISISQIMRKTVVDGSNTSGFQRTVLIARNGYVETRSGKIGIDNVSLEEDSARVVSAVSDPDNQSNLQSSSGSSFKSPTIKDDGKRLLAHSLLDQEGQKVKRFRLDRLGIPLIEIGTAADIKNPEQAKEVALHIGDVLRSCRVKRGIGSIRQDVNVSIVGHPRIEIKGFQDVKMFVPTIEKEVKRQLGNIESKKGLVGEVRNALPDGSSEFLRPMPGAARMYPETDLPLLRISKQIIDEAKRTLPKLRSEIKKDLIRDGLREEEIKILLKMDLLDEFNSLLKILDNSRFVYKILIEIPKQLGKEFEVDVIEEILSAVDKGKIDKYDVKHIMREMAGGKSLKELMLIEKIDSSELESEIINLIKEKPGLSVGGYMGLIMGKFRGKINGKEVNEILNKLLK